MYGFWPLLALAFFLIIMVIGIRRARLEKERVWYLGSVVSLLGVLCSIFLFLDQLMLALLFGVLADLSGVLVWYKSSRVRKREYAKMVEEVNVSTPLRVGDFLSWRAWLIMATRWGVRKTILLYYLFNGLLIGGVLSIASLFLRSLSMTEVLIYTIIASMLPAADLYRRLSKSPSLLKGDLNEK